MSFNNPNHQWGVTLAPMLRCQVIYCDTHSLISRPLPTQAWGDKSERMYEVHAMPGTEHRIGPGDEARNKLTHCNLIM